MALTKVQTIGIETGISLTGVTTVTTLNASTDTLSVGGTVNFGGNVSIAGTLTYEDVTNIDSVGLITARNGINVQSAGLTVVGVTTLSSTKSQFDSTGSLYLNSGGSSNSGNYLAKVGSDGSADFLSNISIADKIIHYGDTNTAIRFPGNDTFTVETSGSEALRIDGSGRLLLGITSNYATGNADDLVIGSNSSSTERGITLGSTVASAIRFADAGSVSAGMIQYVHNASGTDYMNFYTAVTERMRIDSAGSLLVNTTTSRSVMDQAGNGPTPKLQIEGEDSNGIISVISAGDADANRCGTINLGRHRNGTVGGTATIVQNGDALGAVVFSGGDGGDMLTCGAKIHAVVDGAPGANDMPGALIFSTTPDGQGHGFNTERMRIDSSGVVKLTQSGNNPRYGSLEASGDAFRLKAFSGNASHNATMQFFTGANSPTERMRIDSDGHIGVNNTSPGSYYANQLVVDTGSDSQSGITIVSSTSAQGLLAFADGTSGADRYRGFIDYNHSTNHMTFGVNGNTQAALRSGGLFQASSSGNFYGDQTVDFHSFNQDGSGQWTLGARNENSNPYGFIVRYNTDHNDTGHECYYFIADNNARYYVRSNGGIVNYQSNNANLCDEREKKNIVDLDTKWDKVKSWELKKFHYNEDADTDDLRYGVIAQQVEQSCPEVLTEWEKRKAEDAVLDEDGNVVTPAQEQVMRKGVKEQQMMWMAIKALQEAQTRIETLETQLTDALSRITALEG